VYQTRLVFDSRFNGFPNEPVETVSLSALCLDVESGAAESNRGAAI
jgi:hypothetical protein